MSKCPAGQILRKGYTAKRGSKNVRVPAGCIKSVSASGSKRSTKDKAILNKRAKIQKSVSKKYGDVKCGPGKIERAGFTRRAYNRRAYTRKDGTKVHAATIRKSVTKPVCIKDVGNVGKGPKLQLVLEKGVLKKAGYSNVKSMNSRDRHHALDVAERQIGNPLSLYRKLVIVSTMNKNKDPELAHIFKQDANWVKGKYGLSRSGSKSNGKKPKSGSKKTTKTTKTTKSKSKRGSKTSKK